MSRRAAAVSLTALAGLFLLRVTGQLGVLAFEPSWLPRFELWYSGLIPYPLLFPLQVLILLAQAAVCFDLLRARGPRFVPGAALTVFLHRFAIVYALVMTLRLAVLSGAALERSLIPVPFHLCLAAFLFVFARYHTQRRQEIVPCV